MWNCWKTRPMFSRRKRVRSFWLSFVISIPFTSKEPLVGESRHPIRFKSVVFPLPEGPIILAHSPFSIVKLASFNAHVVSYFLTRFFAIIIFIHLLVLQQDRLKL